MESTKSLGVIILKMITPIFLTIFRAALLMVLFHQHFLQQFRKAAKLLKLIEIVCTESRI